METDSTALVRSIKEEFRENSKLSHEIVDYVSFFHDVLGEIPSRDGVGYINYSKLPDITINY